MADPDYWKQTAERQKVVNRFVYSQSPQPIPVSYDPVREAEEILRAQQRSLPPNDPRVRGLWQQIRTLTVKRALSSPLGKAGTFALVAGTAYVGVKIGSGIYAKYFEPEVPEPTPWNPSWPQRLRYATQGEYIYAGLSMPYDGWIWEWNPNSSGYWKGAWLTAMGNGQESACPSIQNPPGIPDGLTHVTGEPHPNCNAYWNGGGNGGVGHLAATPENALGAHSPTVDYTGQPYGYTLPLPPTPSQPTVEQGIETDLGKPENALLRQWLNYALGSPGETDPTGQNPPNAGIEFPDFEEHWYDHETEFPEYSDPWEYWQGAVDIIERGERGGEGIERCERESDGSIIYWDVEKAAIVIVRDGKIVTYFKPDDADAYWLDNCG